MNANLAPEIREVMGALHYRPSVSVILPFEPKMNLKTELILNGYMQHYHIAIYQFQIKKKH